MISLLIVNYRSAALAAAAIRSARDASREPLQVVVVDNSCDPAEADALRGIADELVIADTNRGYAGGINLGRRSCDGDIIIVANPDVLFAPQSIDRLVEPLDHRTAVTGPALFWDDAHEWFLPPGDVHTAWDKLDELLASRSRAWFAFRDRRRFRARVRFWRLTLPTPVRTLSGAVMAIRARDLDDAGGFDERFALYFEETDFLRRIAERRKRIVYVPAAQCRHIYNQSAAGEAGDRYAESERKYFEKWNGPFVARLLLRPPSPRARGEGGRRPGEGRVMTEASPLEDFATAAGTFHNVNTIPEDVAHAWKAAPLYLRHVELDSARVVDLFKIHP